MSQDELVFRGLNAEECTSFIREVHMRAHGACRLRDNAWMADIAVIAFDGDALEWFDEQTPETQADWLLLRRALIHKYSRSHFVPTPPSAIEVPTSIATPIAPISNPSARLDPADSSPISFCIKVIAPRAGYRGYVSQTFEDTNFGQRCTLTENLAEAIELRPSNLPVTFYLYTSDFSGDHITSTRVAVHHTRKSPLCGILASWHPVHVPYPWGPPKPPVYTHHSAKGDEKNDQSFSFWNVDKMGGLSLHHPVGVRAVLTKTVNGGFTLAFWEHRVWDEDDDAYVADLYLVRII